MKGILLILILILGVKERAVAQDFSRVDTVSLELKWYHQFQFAGYYAADIKGFYAEEGLHVNIIEGSLESNQVDNVVNLDVDFAIYDSGLLIEYANGVDVKAINAFFQYSPYVLAVRSNRNFSDLNNLTTSTIMVGNIVGRYELLSWFNERGIPTDSINFIGFDIERFINDPSVDAIHGYITSDIQTISNNVDVDIFYPWQSGVDFYGDVLFTSKRFLENNRNVVDRFQRATLKGWEYARLNQDELINYILTLNGVNERGFNFDNLTLEAEKTWEYSIPDKIPLGFMSEARWNMIARYFQNAGVLSTTPDIEHFIIQPVEPFTAQLQRFLLFFLPIVSGGAVIVGIWIYILKKRIRQNSAALEVAFEERVLLEKESKEHLLKSINQKEEMLSEVHHRVKNNMALITSLIELQIRETNIAVANSILKDAQNRIHTIADIHEKLYENDSFMAIPFKSYVHQQIDYLLSRFDQQMPKITINREIEDLSLNINYSIPVALILNECLTNCFNHAFIGKNDGLITVHLAKELNNRVLLYVKDDGVGFNSKALKNSTIGFTIIRALVEQIDGDLVVDSSEKGTKISVRFSVEVNN